MNDYCYILVISKLDIKSIINLSETCKNLNFIIKESFYAKILWNKYFNLLRKTDTDLLHLKSSQDIFKLCALETFKKNKYKTDRILTEYFQFLTNKQIESYLNSKKCKDI